MVSRTSTRRVFVVLLLIIAVGCEKSAPLPIVDQNTTSTPKKLEIVATVGMVTDIVREVVGDRANVTGLLGEGTDPHLYTAGRRDVARMSNADVIFYSGLQLEGNMQRTLESAARTRKVFAVTDVLKKTYLRSPPEFEGHPDPHVWMDPNAWSQCVGYVADRLSEFDSEGKQSYQDNAAAYQKRILELNAYVQKIMATVPKPRRYLVTAHDAFGYFARAYQLEVKSAQGISTQSEAAVADINALVTFLVEHDIPALFVESSVSPKNMEAVLEGCKNKGRAVRIGAQLYSDAMGAPGTYEGTYLGMIDHNATRIVQALGGEAPARGWQGKLAIDTD